MAPAYHRTRGHTTQLCIILPMISSFVSGGDEHPGKIYVSVSVGVGAVSLQVMRSTAGEDEKRNNVSFPQNPHPSFLFENEKKRPTVMVSAKKTSKYINIVNLSYLWYPLK